MDAMITAEEARRRTEIAARLRDVRIAEEKKKEARERTKRVKELLPETIETLRPRVFAAINEAISVGRFQSAI